MVWVVGRKKGENKQGALRPGEFKRPDQEGARPKPRAFRLHLGLSGLSSALTTNHSSPMKQER